MREDREFQPPSVVENGKTRVFVSADGRTVTIDAQLAYIEVRGRDNRVHVADHFATVTYWGEEMGNVLERDEPNRRFRSPV